MSQKSKNLRKYLASKDISIVKFSEMIGRSRNTVSVWMKGYFPANFIERYGGEFNELFDDSLEDVLNGNVKIESKIKDIKTRRFFKWIDIADVSIADIASVIGKSHSAVSQWQKSGLPNSFNKKYADVISEHFNVDLLNIVNDPVPSVTAGKVRAVPDLTIRTGSIQTADIFNEIANVKGRTRTKDFMVYGKSMQPNFLEGDIVIGEAIHDHDDFPGNIRNGFVYIIVALDDKAVIKRCTYNDDRQCVVMKSDNPETKTFSWGLSNIKEMYLFKLRLTSYASPPQGIWDLVRELDERVRMLEEN